MNSASEVLLTDTRNKVLLELAILDDDDCRSLGQRENLSQVAGLVRTSFQAECDSLGLDQFLDLRVLKKVSLPSLTLIISI